MLGKLLNTFRRHGPSKPPHKSKSSALKLVHPGGYVECYYMEMSASKLMERYPSFYITKPNVFKQPWDSIIQPDDTLFPGQKFYIVPQKTVKKLHRRFQKPNSTNLTSYDSVTRNTNVTTAKISAKKCFGIDESAEYDQSLDFSKSINGGMSSKKRGKKVVQVAAWHPALESISEM